MQFAELFQHTAKSRVARNERPGRVLQNGYWMSLGWCILLFVPLVLTAQRLAELYMQIDPYPGPLVEA